MSESGTPSKGDIVREALIRVVQDQMKMRHVARAVRTQKAFALLHVKDDDIANEAYLAMIYDHIISTKAPV